jgi:three-Cys-motif partner protein
MALPEETLWQIEPHTRAKHIILKTYLDAWFPILSKYNQRIVYIDGFSGSGRYANGELGSPLVAIECARAHRAKLKGELVFYFIEIRRDRADHLRKELAELQLPAHFKVFVENGTFSEELTRALDELDTSGKRSAPTFALVDPFGFSGIPYSLIKRLLAAGKCEVLITFMADSMNRWLTHPDEKIQEHIVETFGTEEALGVAEGPGDRVTGLKNLYQVQLMAIAKFVRYFEMRDRKNRVVYYLFFASNNALGHLKMKEAMWKVDPMGDFSFSDATNPYQQLIFESPSSVPLGQELISTFSGKGQIPVDVVETHVFDETPYLRKHMREALATLESSGKLEIAATKVDGKKRLAGTYPNEALVTFL